MSKRSDKKKNLTIIIFFAGIFTLAAIIFGYEGYKKAYHGFMLAQYPLEYSSFVEKYADEYGLDKYILYAVIKTESDFDPKAVSNTDARGLMQIMETTFDWIKFRLGDETSEYSDMFDPETNIRYGAYLVDYLINKYGSLDTAAAAYFSGTGTVDGWLEDKSISADGVHLDSIPSRNAAHYVNKINTALTAYLELYGEQTAVNER